MEWCTTKAEFMARWSCWQKLPNSSQHKLDLYDEIDLLMGDWFSGDYKEIAKMDDISSSAILMNGKGPYGDPRSTDHESFPVTKGKTYRFRISNVGGSYNFNFRIQNHKTVVVETEGSYTNQTTLDSLDVHVGQSYSVLVTADRIEADYYIVVTSKLLNSTGFNSSIIGLGVLHYSKSDSQVTGPLPDGPDPFDIDFSVTQVKSIMELEVCKLSNVYTTILIYSFSS
ncbi:hypothetical protein SLA2020_391270 [Shorea laevis]